MPLSDSSACPVSAFVNHRGALCLDAPVSVTASPVLSLNRWRTRPRRPVPRRPVLRHDERLFSTAAAFLAEGLIAGEPAHDHRFAAHREGMLGQLDARLIHVDTRAGAVTSWCSTPTRCWRSSWSTASPIRDSSTRTSGASSNRCSRGGRGRSCAPTAGWWTSCGSRDRPTPRSGSKSSGTACHAVRPGAPLRICDGQLLQAGGPAPGHLQPPHAHLRPGALEPVPQTRDPLSAPARLRPARRAVRRRGSGDRSSPAEAFCTAWRQPPRRRPSSAPGSARRSSPSASRRSDARSGRGRGSSNRRRAWATPRSSCAESKARWT